MTTDVQHQLTIAVTKSRGSIQPPWYWTVLIGPVKIADGRAESVHAALGDANAAAQDLADHLLQQGTFGS